MHYNIVKSTNRRYLEELKNRFGDMPDVVNSINIVPGGGLGGSGGTFSSGFWTLYGA